LYGIKKTKKTEEKRTRKAYWPPVSSNASWQIRQRTALGIKDRRFSEIFLLQSSQMP